MQMCGMQNSHRKFYEAVLSDSAEAETKRQAVLSILRLALTDHSHFSFLLSQINWFCPSNKPLLPLLDKILRLYRGICRQAPKVVFNMLAEGLTSPDAHLSIVDILASILTTSPDHSAILECLRENYPHKVCEQEQHIAYLDSMLLLCERQPLLRFDLLETIIENLAAFDTEMSLEQEDHQFLPNDYEAPCLQEAWGGLESKYDAALSRLIGFIVKFDALGQETLLKEVFITFEKVVLSITSTKMIQLVMFAAAELSDKTSSTFVALLVSTVMEEYAREEGQTRKLALALNYLTSYIYRSLALSPKRARRVVSLLMAALTDRIRDKPTTSFQDLDFKRFYRQNAAHLFMFNAVLLALANSPLEGSFSHQLPTLLSLGQQKLMIQLFLDGQLLQFYDIQSMLPQSSHDRIKIQHKFRLPLLPKSKALIRMRSDGLKRGRPGQSEWGQSEWGPSEWGRRGWGARKERGGKRGQEHTPITIGEGCEI